jgi:hypothetical protein
VEDLEGFVGCAPVGIGIAVWIRIWIGCHFLNGFSGLWDGRSEV